jgi:starch phosphorylase
MRSIDPHEYIGNELSRVFDSISKGTFGNREELIAMIDSIRHRNDFYLVCHDFYSYLEAQKKV